MVSAKVHLTFVLALMLEEKEKRLRFFLAAFLVISFSALF
jgi:hypothetical protein